MQNLSALKELTHKLDEIKETWQIYAIFEEARQNFYQEFNALSKDKEALIASFNDTSAKHALLLAENKELEERNKALQEGNSTLEEMQNTEQTYGVGSKDLAHLYAQCETLQETLKAMQGVFTKLADLAPEPVEKLEVSYQKQQRLLANPARGYVTLERATELFEALVSAESKLKALDLELAKLRVEMRDLLHNTPTPTQDTPLEAHNTPQNTQEIEDLTSHIALETDVYLQSQDSINSTDSIHSS